MADFTKAYNKTSVNEGGWSDDPDDKGGQTWKGIARNLHPLWEGWSLIDLYKSDKNFPECLKQIEKLELAAKKFYKKEFFDVVKGDHLLIQEIADSLYDSAVNFGTKRAIILSQKALEIKETGIIDETMLNLLNNKA